MMTEQLDYLLAGGWWLEMDRHGADTYLVTGKLAGSQIIRGGRSLPEAVDNFFVSAKQFEQRRNTELAFCTQGIPLCR